MTRKTPVALLAAVLCLPIHAALAADPEMPPATEAEAQIYGSDLMSAEERLEYRTRMRSLKTMEERQAFREEHHRQMLERAKVQGVKLPDMPPERPMGGPGMGPGGGMGGGMGSGGRMMQ